MHAASNGKRQLHWHCSILQGHRIFNTWTGDPSKVALLEEVVKVVKRDDLLTGVNETGSYLQAGLKQIQV